MKTREAIRRVLADGWEELPRGSTSHRQFKHPVKPGKVTISIKGSKELDARAEHSVRIQAQIDKKRWEQL